MTELRGFYAVNADTGAMLLNRLSWRRPQQLFVCRQALRGLVSGPVSKFLGSGNGTASLSVVGLGIAQATPDLFLSFFQDIADDPSRSSDLGV